MTTTTTHYNLIKSQIGGRTDQWGQDIHDSYDIIDSQMKANEDNANSRLEKSQNLSDVDNVTTARQNIGAHNASNLTTGTLPIARIGDGDVTNAKLASGIDAGKLTTGTLPDARISAAIMRGANNLSDVSNAGTARNNLGLGTAATQADTRYNHRSNNLSDVANAATARSNIGANNAGNLTTGTLPNARLSSDVPTDVQEATVTLGGDFSGTNNLRIRRVGKIVTLFSLGSVSHTNDSEATSAPGVIPSWARPSHDVQNLFGFTFVRLSQVFVTTGGTLSVYYANQEWDLQNNSSTGNPIHITYNVA